MSLIPNEKLLELINALYTAANQQAPAMWTEVFSEISAALSSGPGSLTLYSPENKKYSFFVTTLDQELFKEYDSHYQYISPFRQQIAQMKPGQRFNRAESLPDEEFLKTEFYQDYLRKQNAFDFEYRVLFKEGETLAGVSFSRPYGMENFGVREIGFMNLITPHLEKAFHIYVKFEEIKRSKEILSECFEKISQGIIVVNKAGKVVYMNESASNLVTARDGVQTNINGILSANTAEDSKKLKLLLQSVFEPNLERHTSFGGFLQIAGRKSARPFSVFVVPFSERCDIIFGAERMALLLINDPEQQIKDIEPILSGFYGLTPAESKIATILTQGKSVSDACAILGVKPNTIRTHLKRIFSKTATKRQSELVKLIHDNLNNVKIV